MKGSWLATALVGMASLGCTTEPDPYPWSSGAAPAPTPALPLPPPPPIRIAAVAGRWGVLQQHTESDAVVLNERAGVLSGTGCSGYLPPEGSDDQGTCGPITGTIDQRHVTFRFEVGFSGGATFAADVYLSADGNRMAGRHFTALTERAPLDGPGWLSEPTAWGRLAPTESWFARPAWPADLDRAWKSPDAGYHLTLVDAPTNGGDFSSLRSYRIAQLGSGLVGNLGAFMPKEISFIRGPAGETATILAGPVPETAPGLPVALKLSLQGGALVRVEASMASGQTYAFTAVPR